MLLPVQKQFSRRSEGDKRGDDQQVSQRDHLGEQSLSAQLENTFAHLIAAHIVASGCLWRGRRDAVLRCVASCGPGGQIIFTYVHSGILDGSVCFEGGDHLLRDVARLDERWTFGFSPDQLAEFLCNRGLRLDCDLSPCEYRSRYFGAAAQSNEGLRVLSCRGCIRVATSPVLL